MLNEFIFHWHPMLSMLQSFPKLEKCPLCPRGTPPSFGGRSKLPARRIIRMRQIGPRNTFKKTPRAMAFDPGNLDSQRCNLRWQVAMPAMLIADQLPSTFIKFPYMFFFLPAFLN